MKKSGLSIKEQVKFYGNISFPYGGYATPATYEVDHEQYVVIAAGGGGKVGTKSGDVYIAFKLKNRK